LEFETPFAFILPPLDQHHFKHEAFGPLPDPSLGLQEEHRSRGRRGELNMEREREGDGYR
jgi:hypothetical protein